MGQCLRSMRMGTLPEPSGVGGGVPVSANHVRNLFRGDCGFWRSACCPTSVFQFVRPQHISGGWCLRCTCSHGAITCGDPAGGGAQAPNAPKVTPVSVPDANASKVQQRNYGIRTYLFIGDEDVTEGMSFNPRFPDECDRTVNVRPSAFFPCSLIKPYHPFAKNHSL